MVHLEEKADISNANEYSVSCRFCVFRANATETGGVFSLYVKKCLDSHLPSGCKMLPKRKRFISGKCGRTCINLRTFGSIMGMHSLLKPGKRTFKKFSVIKDNITVLL